MFVLRSEIRYSRVATGTSHDGTVMTETVNTAYDIYGIVALGRVYVEFFVQVEIRHLGDILTIQKIRI